MAEFRRSCGKNDTWSFDFAFHKFIDPDDFFIVLAWYTDNTDTVSEFGVWLGDGFCGFVLVRSWNGSGIYVDYCVLGCIMFGTG